MGEYDERAGSRPSRAFELESIRRELMLMHAFIKDSEGVGDQSKRVGCWLKQMKSLALELDAFNTFIQRHKDKMKGGLVGPLLLCKEFMFVLPTIEMKIEEISSNFHAISERKRTYDIGKFQGKGDGVLGFKTCHEPQHLFLIVLLKIMIKTWRKLSQAPRSSTQRQEEILARLKKLAVRFILCLKDRGIMR